ncbi:motility associated factor glycosyltransferase family protein [Rheinheimera sp. UJ63]|uniref:motility associated factor glycosyltransferase family protein n=1 Tax=Rheinheimera sp. UJ63 TaxID=2910157 RepID=UPI001F42CAD0|nr:6-hydroxymethylpterin diphosphokinase MptE-like protein [Rheinheimera sp. UJ63]MCF4009082.1 DUF115 domain-containing protein [Rheinheimera sp. UJ63]
MLSNTNNAATKSGTCYNAKYGINKLQYSVNTASLATAFNVKERVLLGTADHNALLHALQNSESLLVFQPDLDFLYASFFTVPWYQATAQVVICTEIKTLEQHLITEYQSGNLDLINFYIDMPYYEQHLFAAYQLLRELVQNTNGKTNYVEKQLQSVSRCFTNSKQARYLVSTTPVLTEPVCIIGNGPSLDLHLTFLRENRQGLILISCGTALITLQRHGLVPDFHVDLERGIDTLERLQQLPRNYLKQINLISPLDQHPQICKLFQTALLVTLAGQECRSELEYNLAPKQLLALHYAYYTVTNLAVDLALTIGCQNLFLIGIDFGFKYLTAHHAKASDYFTSQGTEIYDFELAHGAAYKVEANFGGHCLTVPPFDAARKLMSERIKLASTQKVYNCNDGAKIEGAIALTKPQITIQTEAVAAALNTINNLFIKPKAFSTASSSHHYIEDSIKLVEQMLALSAKGAQISLQQQVAIKRQILEKTKLNQQHTCYQLFNGALRYIEMVTATLHYFALPTTRFDTVRQAWLNYLAHCLLQLKRESQKSAAPSH